MTGQRQDAERWRVVRELFEDCHAPGAEVSYSDVTLQKLAWCEDHSMWRVFVAEQWVDTVRVGRFRSTHDLNEHMAMVETIDPPENSVPLLGEA